MRVKLTVLQEDVLRLVCEAQPHADPDSIAQELNRPNSVINVALDALTRRNLVTPVGSWNGRSAIYVATAKGKKRT